MKFYSGFSLRNEAYLFEPYLNKSDYCVAGFSYGAIKAVEFTLKALEKSQRVDRLQLLSPAFFQTKEEKFKRLQLLSYKKNRDIYLRTFIKGCFSPYESKIIEQKESSIESLEELLRYEWRLDSLEKIVKSGVVVEVYLGGKDAIIDVEAARDFFLQVATVSYIKNANHFLQVL